MVITAWVAGAVVAAGLWVLLAPAFGAEVFTRQNFRGRELPTGAGVILALVAVSGDAVVSVVDAAGTDPDPQLLLGLRSASLVALGFALLGLLDDLGGAGQSGGFRGHLAELGRGRLTTGAVKLVGGAAIGVVAASGMSAVSGVSDVSLGRLLADGALIGLAANLGNLFDRAPGRAIKVSLLAWVGLVAAIGFEPILTGTALAVGAATGLLIPDLRERLMLGDAGANVLGGVLGTGAVLACAPTTRTVVLVLVAALNATSEVVSFSKVIDRVTPLRALDHLGRRP